MRMRALLAALLIAAVFVGVGLQVGFAQSGGTNMSTMAMPSGSAMPPNFTLPLPAPYRGVAPYPVTLIVLNVPWNSTATQPAFYMVGNGGLTGADNVSLPADTLIRLTIITYDTPSSEPPPAQYANVTGVVGGKVLVVNGTISLNGPMNVSVGSLVSSVPLASIAHTFTIPKYNVNIPLVGTSTEIAYLYINGTGATQYQCLVPCGFKSISGGWSAAMISSGWMTGTINVYTPTAQQGGASPRNATSESPVAAADTPSAVLVLASAAVAFLVLLVLFFVFRR